MKDPECVEFLQWALPRLRMRWPGFRKVRRQVCKRVQRRARELDLPGAHAYRDYLIRNPDEWRILDRLCVITISTFYRDRAVFDFLGSNVLPALARGVAERRDAMLRTWSIGCASGEEPYSVMLVWRFAVQPHLPALGLRVLATDIDDAMLDRARAGCYAASSLKLVPEPWRHEAFEQFGNRYCLRSGYRGDIEFVHQDVRAALPEGNFDLILCRNLVFTYFDAALQRVMLTRFLAHLRPAGSLVIGKHETLPVDMARLAPWVGAELLGIYRRTEPEEMGRTSGAG